ncbi:MAG: hypothetical protein KBT06_03675 [Prevotellaceae bacterium]|nr:hypothetical protein [Candidatus Colivivens equi]
MRYLLLFCICIGFLLSSCGATSKTVYFQCDRQDVQLYINEQLIGSGQGTYSTEPGEERIHLSCRQNGKEVYSRDYQLSKSSSIYYEVSIPKNLRYGSSETIKPTYK